MTACTTFVGGVNPFLAIRPDYRVTAMQLLVIDGLKRYGPIRAIALAGKLDISVVSAREVLLRLAKKGTISKVSGSGYPIYYLETLQ